MCTYFMKTLRSYDLCGVSGAKVWNSDLMLSQVSHAAPRLYAEIEFQGSRLFLFLKISSRRYFY